MVLLADGRSSNATQLPIDRHTGIFKLQYPQVAPNKLCVKLHHKELQSIHQKMKLLISPKYRQQKLVHVQ